MFRKLICGETRKLFWKLFQTIPDDFQNKSALKLVCGDMKNFVVF